MRIIHVSDTHLGFSAFSKVDEASGLNLREMDFYRAFEEFVDLALKAKPDLVLHTGDLFDSVRPSNRALSLALEQLLRFSESGIPVVLIAGNHSTPKLRETGSVFRLFEHLKDVYPIYKGEYERLDIGEAAVHALPHCEPEIMNKELAKFSPAKKRYNLGMLHAGVSSLRMFRMGEFNESIVPSSMLRTDLDYFALGHYHNYCDVTKNAYYSGSTERLSFAEAGEKKGFVLVDLAKRKQEFRALHSRPMVDLLPINARTLDAVGLRSEISSLLQSVDMEGKLVRMQIRCLPSSLYKSIDFHWLRSLTSSALHFEPKLDLVPEDSSVQSTGSSIDSLEKEWVSFLESHPLERANKDRIRERGLRYLQEAEESD
jgi:DNA repair exonuclease SbcCD nuclease subunit